MADATSNDPPNKLFCVELELEYKISSQKSGHKPNGKVCNIISTMHKLSLTKFFDRQAPTSPSDPSLLKTFFFVVPVHTHTNEAANVGVKCLQRTGGDKRDIYEEEWDCPPLEYAHKRPMSEEIIETEEETVGHLLSLKQRSPLHTYTEVPTHLHLEEIKGIFM
eukprot:CAMPEP_0174276962 /NCGR_PEP_ID=MMETSP0439-20130205/60672_1 /TAXON_ID=0 /ORGANISM="Stereomyxa ramosa, Strain Chinc5" /LENGTH=163 /DNA_ID=CAMNT_0015369239 /DNA_START=2355 /DNA_END=2844 /DNA_ORIENTATION=-